MLMNLMHFSNMLVFWPLIEPLISGSCFCLLCVHTTHIQRLLCRQHRCCLCFLASSTSSASFIPLVVLPFSQCLCPVSIIKSCLPFVLFSDGGSFKKSFKNCNTYRDSCPNTCKLWGHSHTHNSAGRRQEEQLKKYENSALQMLIRKCTEYVG